MGTGAFMSLRNNLASPLTCTVSNPVCMYANGADGSHLEYFNTILPPQGLLNSVYIEADGSLSDGCSFTQSQFTLSFSGGSGDIGAVTLNLGSGGFNTSVVYNTAPQAIQVDIGPQGGQYSISVQVNPLPIADQLVNSWIWANASAIQQALTLPPTSWGPFTFQASALQGLDTLSCVQTEVSGSASGVIQMAITLTASQLATTGQITIADIPLPATGLTLEQPQISVSASIIFSESGNTVQLTGFQLTSGTVDLVIGISIPDPTLSLLLQAVEAIVNNPPVQTVILDTINQYLPHASS